MASSSGQAVGEITKLNVGGVFFSTSFSTLIKRECFFRGLINGMEKQNVYFIDRDPTHFRYILNWLRGVAYLPDNADTLQELACEADFYALVDLRDSILQKKASPSISKSLHAIECELRMR
jgi:hypothetical protein